jgi:hypothetical protein
MDSAAARQYWDEEVAYEIQRWYMSGDIEKRKQE